MSVGFFEIVYNKKLSKKLRELKWLIHRKPKLAIDKQFRNKLTD